jgi:hypothetical protein
MRTTRFWKSLDGLTDAATDAREWRARLGPEWLVAAPLLRSTGGLARSIACPSPGGTGCPRRVVRHDDGSIRAVCGESPRICDDLDLARDDIAILRLDRPKLIRAIAVALSLSLSERPAATNAGAVIEIGTHEVHAGRGFPVFLVVPGPWFGNEIEPFAELVTVSGPKVLLTPTRLSLGAAATHYLETIGVTRFALADVLVADDRHRLGVSQPVEVLFAALRAAVARTSDVPDAGLVWPLPPDARWEEVTVAFVADEVINVSFRGQTRRFEPDQLGMKDARSGKPKRQWTYMKALARSGGVLPVDPPHGVRGHQKQKQELSALLRACFGITDEPIPVHGRDYRARFVIRADDLDQGKPGQRQRKFAGDA